MARSLAHVLGVLDERPDDAPALEELRALSRDTSAQATTLLGDRPTELLEAARLIQLRRGDISAAVVVLEAECELARGKPQEIGFAWELGRLYRDELFDDAGAERAFKRVVELRPDDADARAVLERIAETRGRHVEIAARFMSEATNATEPSLVASLLLRSAAVQWSFAGQSADVVPLLERALSAEPTNANVLAFYERVLMSLGRAREAADLLLGASNRLTDREARIRALLRGGRILSEAEANSPRAADAFRAVLEMSPTQSEAMRRLVRMYEANEQWDELAKLYDASLRARSGTEAERGALLQLAMVHWRMRDKAKEAEPYFARLRKLEPAHPAVLDFYRAFLAGTDDARLLGLLSDAQRTASDPGRKLQLSIEIAQFAATQPSLIERAIDAWKTVERLDPTNGEAQTSLRKLYRDAGKWNALAESIKGEVDRLPSQESAKRITLLKELAAVYRDRLNLEAMVVNTYNAIVAADPSDRETLTALAQIHERTMRWADLVTALTRLADSSTDTQEKIALRLRIADVWVSRFANYHQASVPLEDVLALDPQNREALNRLKDIYTKKRAWTQLFDVMSREAELASDPTARLANLVELAKLATEKLQSGTEAIRLWRRVLDTEPTTSGGLDALERLAEKERDFESLAYVLERRATAGAVEDQIRVLSRLGAVYGDSLRDPARAANAWNRVLAIDTRNARALRTLRETFLQGEDWDGLEALYGQAGDFEGLVDVLGTAADRSTDPQKKVALSQRAARVYEVELAQPHRAFRSYERILAVGDASAGAGSDAARKLLAICESELKWSRVAELLAFLAGRSNDVNEQRALRIRHIDVVAQQLGDPARAFVAASELFVEWPDASVRTRLEALAGRANLHKEIVAAYRVRLNAAGVPRDEAVALRRHIAQLLFDELGERLAGAEELRKVVELDPNDTDSRTLIERILIEENRRGELRTHYVEWLDQLDQRSKQSSNDAVAAVRESIISTLLKLGALEEGMGLANQAASHYQAALDHDQTSTAALVSLDRVFTGANQTAELIQVLQQRVPLAKDDREKIDLEIRLANLYRETGATSRAVDLFIAILDRKPSDGRAITGIEVAIGGDVALSRRASPTLERAYETTGAYAKLVPLLEASLANESGDAKRTLQVRIATLRSTKLGQSDAAYLALEKAFLDAPADRALWSSLEDAARGANAAPQLAVAFATAAEAGDVSNEIREELARRAAAIFGQVERNDDAARMHALVLATSPSDPEAFAWLKQHHTSNEEWDALKALYRDAIGSASKARRVELLGELAFLQEEILDDAPAAIVAYREALDIDPTNDTPAIALIRLYRRGGHAKELAELLEGRLASSEPSAHERIELTLELADLYSKKLDEHERALELYEAVFSDQPSNEDAFAGIEAALATDAKLRAARVLTPVYERRGNWGELVSVLRIELSAATDERPALFARIADILEQRVEDASGAFDAYAELVRANPDDASARSDLARVASRASRMLERAELLERLSVSRADQRITLLLEAAPLFEALNEVNRAIRAYETVLDTAAEARSKDPAAFAEELQRAGEELERMYAVSGRRGDIARALRARLDAANTLRGQDESNAIRQALARSLENDCGELDQAIDTYREMEMSQDPDTRELARVELERILVAQERYAEAAKVIRSRADEETDQQAQEELYIRLAAIQTGRLDDSAEAIRTLDHAIEQSGGSARIYAALLPLLANTTRHGDLIRALERERDFIADDATRSADNLIERAELLRTKLARTDEAIDLYMETLERAPDDARARHAFSVMLSADAPPALRRSAAERYAAFAEARNEPETLLACLAALVDLSDDGDKLAAARRAANLADEKLSRPHTAFEWSLRALALGAATDDAMSVLNEAVARAQTTGQPALLVEALRALPREAMNDDTRAEYDLTIARLADSQLSDLALARPYYERALSQRGDDEETLRALLRIDRAAATDGGPDAAANLPKTLGRLAALIDNAEERTSLLLERAQLLEKLGETTSAIELYRELTEQPVLLAFPPLVAILGDRKDWNAVAETLERWLELADDAERRFLLAQIYIDRLEDIERGLDALTLVLELAPTHAGTAARLARLLAQPGAHRVRAAEMLEPVCVATQDWSGLVATLEARVNEETDTDVRRKLLLRIASHREEQLEDLDGAYDAYARIVADDARDTEAREAVFRLARVLDRLPAAAVLFDSILEREATWDTPLLELANATARLHEARTGDHARAGAIYKRILASADDPATAQTAFVNAERALRTAQDGPGLIALLEAREQDTPNDSERVDILRKLSALHMGANDTARADESFLRLLQIDPKDREALEQRDALLSRAGRNQDLTSHLEQRIEAASSAAERVSLRSRLADLYFTSLNDEERAVDAYEANLGDKPGHEETVAALERMVTQVVDITRIVDILEPIYRRTDQWKKLVAVLEARSSKAEKHDREPLLTEAAELHELRGEDVALAFDAWIRVLESNPESERARNELVRLASAEDAWDALATAFERGVAASADDRIKAPLQLQLARLADERLGDPRRAITHYEAALPFMTDDDTLLDSLKYLYTLVADWTGVIAVSERRIENTFDPLERSQIFRSIGEIREEHLNDPLRAIEAYELAASSDETDRIALESLARLYEQTGAPEQLIGTLRRLLHALGDVEERSPIAMKLARLVEDVAHDRRDSISIVTAALGDDPTNKLLLSYATELFERENMWPDLVDNLRERARLAEDDHARVPLLHRAGEVSLVMGEPAEAVTGFHLVLMLNPRFLQTVNALVTLLDNADVRADVVAVLEPALVQTEQWGTLAVVLERTIEGENDPVEKLARLRQLGGVQETGRQDTRAAFEVFQRALAIDPSDEPTARDLERVGREIDAHEEIVATFRRISSETSDPRDARQLLVRWAHIAEHELGDPGSAIDALTRLVTFDESPEWLTALGRLYRATSRWADLAANLVARRTNATDAEEIAVVTLELADLQHRRLGDLRGALGLYDELLEGNPEHTTARDAVRELAEEPALADDAIALLERTFRQTQSDAGLASLAELRALKTEEPEGRATFYDEASQIWAERVRDFDKALASKVRAFQAIPSETSRLGEITQLASAATTRSSIVGVIEEAVTEGTLGPDAIREARYTAARWYHELVPDPERYERQLREIIAAGNVRIESSGEHRAELDAYSMLAEELAKHPSRARDLVDILLAWAGQDPDRESQRERYREAAGIAERAANDLELATRALDLVLSVDGNDREALTELMRLHHSRGRRSEAVEIGKRLLTIEPNDDARRELRRSIAAELFADRRNAEAVAVLEEQLRESPADEEILEQLLAHHTAEESYADAVGTLERLEFASRDPARAAALALQAATVTQTKLSDAPRAAELFARAATERATAETRDAAERALAAHFEAYNDYERLGELVRTQIQRSPDTAKWLYLGRLERDRLGHPDQAREAFEAVYEAATAGSADAKTALLALDELQAMATAAADHELVASVLERRISLIDPRAEGAAYAETVRAAANVAQDALSDSDRALRVVRTGAANLPSLRGDLRQHLETRGLWADVLEMLDEDLAQAAGPARIALLREGAGIASTKLQDFERATAYLERASSEDPENRDVLAALCDAYVAAGRGKDAVPLLERIIGTFAGKRTKEAAIYHHRLARALEGTGNRTAALVHYDAAFKIDLTSIPILADLGRAAFEGGDLERAQKTFRALLLQKIEPGAPVTKGDVYWYLAQIAIKQGDKPKAVSFLERAVAEDKQHPRASELLQSLRP